MTFGRGGAALQLTRTGLKHPLWGKSEIGLLRLTPALSIFFVLSKRGCYGNENGEGACMGVVLRDRWGEHPHRNDNAAYLK